MIDTIQRLLELSLFTIYYSFIYLLQYNTTTNNWFPQLYALFLATV